MTIGSLIDPELVPFLGALLSFDFRPEMLDEAEHPKHVRQRFTVVDAS
jgi:hypothetical protein